jgi:ribosomal protein L6P/L9E
VVSEKTNFKKEVVASQKESFHNVESLREIGLTRKEYYNRYRGKLLSFARQLRSSMKGITQGYTLNLRLEGVGFEAKGLTVDVTIQENIKQSLIEELNNNSKTSEIEDRIHGMKKKS